MAQINRIDQPGSDVDVYVSYMSENLATKQKLIDSLRDQLLSFQNHLREEERLSRVFQQHSSSSLEMLASG